jgi:cell division protein ZapA
MGKRNVTVDIFGQRYSLKSEVAEEQVKKVAAYVDGKMREVAEGTKSVDSLHIAILAALNITEEYLQEKGSREYLVRRIEDKTDRLEEFITSHMG